MEPVQGQRALAAGTLLVAVAAVVWLLVLGAGSTDAAGGHGKHRMHAPEGFLGVLSGPTPFNSTDAAKLAQTNVRAVRISLQWYREQPHRGAFVWTTSDVMIARLAANGIAAVPTLSGTPSWVAGTRTTAPVVNGAVKAAWQTFVTAVVRRYGRNGTFWAPGPNGAPSPFHARCGCNAPPMPIEAWQIWNEPNLEHYFAPRPSPQQYAKLVKLSDLAVKVADSRATVVLAGLSNGGGNRGDIAAIPYLRRLYRVPGIKRSFDATAIHPYARTIGEMRSAISKFRKVMEKAHDARTPLWLTEIGWGSGHRNRFGLNKGLGGQQRMLQGAMKLILRERKAWRIEHAFWFFWRDPPKTAAATHRACSFCSSAGLLWNSGHPKPAYKAYARVLKRPR